MGLISSLPSRPLKAPELSSLNRADAFELVVSVESEEPARSLLFATETWVKGALFDEDEGWTVVETVELGDELQRVDGLQACEEAIVAARDEGESN
ncbi:hypothetical protein ACFQJC_08865 [Haloferax namakaokahaiae]|uniref:DUF7964 domain-containing protein n=1 Tax=Haloferax namakaokahaiae TaxID=1748331 RepID=A0ABD5ZES0_9EURY